MKKIKLFNIFEIALIILTPVLFLIITTPEILNIINEYRQMEFITTSKLIALNSEIKYYIDTINNVEDIITCDEIIDLDKNNYESCSIYMDGMTSLVTLIGKNKYEGMNICNGTKDSSNLVNSCSGICTTNSYVEITTPYELNSYDACTQYTSAIFKQRGYTDEKIKLFCSGKTVDGWTFSDNIEYVINKGYSAKKLVINNVIKGKVNNMCIPNKTHIKCYKYDIYEDNDHMYAKITNYDDRCGYQVDIPEKIDGFVVESIGEGAFLESNITSVKFPNTIRYIENNAFRGIGEKDSLNAKGVSIVGKLDLSNTQIESIGYFAFADNNISEVKFPNSLKNIYGYSFSRNDIVGELDLSKTKIDSLGEYAFSSNKITNIKLPNSIKSIGFTAFASNNLTDLNLSNCDNLITISAEAFTNNEIENIKLPENIETIGKYAFYNNKISSIKLPKSIKSIGNNAFYKGPESNPDLLEIINLSNEEFNWNSITGKGTIDTCLFTEGICDDIKISVK